MSRAARAGVVAKASGTIEQLGEARSVLLDKTGTVTFGHPELSGVVRADGLSADDALRLAASVDQMSTHPLAKALVPGAEQRNLALTIPECVEESFGNGVGGTVDGHRILVGSTRWLRSQGVEAHLPPSVDGGDAKVLIAVDDRLAGVAPIGDRVRDDSAELVRKLRDVGVRHVAPVTGQAGDRGDRRREARRRPRLRGAESRAEGRGRPRGVRAAGVAQRRHGRRRARAGGCRRGHRDGLGRRHGLLRDG
jgi:P-type E1-E2 ATPase